MSIRKQNRTLSHLEKQSVKECGSLSFTYLGNDNKKTEGDDAGVPHVNHLEVRRLDGGRGGGGEQGCQHKLRCQGHHDAVREVVDLKIKNFI